MVATGYSRVESNYDDDLKKSRTRFGTGQTEQVEVPAPELPPRSEPIIEEPLLVPVYAGESTVFATADTPLRSSAVGEAPRFPGQYEMPPPVPAAQEHMMASSHVGDRSIGESMENFDEPTYLRHMARGEGAKRQPVVRNPFTASGGAEDLDTPAYLRTCRKDLQEGQPVDQDWHR